ncbi:MAG TPA: hypothetical protein VJ323_07970, partial [Bryobacteraceae bacterium]|nr:hypothetical protein [Bryobacteraceae bacterium]
PSNVSVTTATLSNVGLFVIKNHKTTYRFSGMKLSSTSGGGAHGIVSSTGAYAEYGQMEFGAFAGGTSQQLRAEDNGLIKCIGNYAISGGAGAHWTSNGGGGMRCQFMTITLSNTPDFSGLGFCNAQYASQCIVNGNTFPGTVATGKHYMVTENSLIKTNGAGETYLPGNATGSMATQGLYV